MKTFAREDFLHYNFAHRGLHDIHRGIPENSLSAYRAAVEAGYGIELDVQLSGDGQVVVFHDDDLKRVCGVDTRVEAMTFEALQTLRLLGTEEKIPLFTEALEVIGQGTGPLIVEIKTGRSNAELCRKTADILAHYPGVSCIESFDPMIVNWFRRNAPEVFRGQLAARMEAYVPKYPKWIAYLLANCWFSLLNRPDFIAYENGERPKRIRRLRKKGVLLFGWTSRQPHTDQAQNDAVIFEQYLPAVKYEDSE